MICVICKHGTSVDGEVTVTLYRGSTVVVIKSVPAMVCENCGEYYLNEKIFRRVYEIAEEAYPKGLEVEIVRYAA